MPPCVPGLSEQRMLPPAWPETRAAEMCRCVLCAVWAVEEIPLPRLHFEWCITAWHSQADACKHLWELLSPCSASSSGLYSQQLRACWFVEESAASLQDSTPQWPLPPVCLPPSLSHRWLHGLSATSHRLTFTTSFSQPTQTSRRCVVSHHPAFTFTECRAKLTPRLIGVNPDIPPADPLTLLPSSPP